jgi:carboxymethylenebutenolidase
MTLPTFLNDVAAAVEYLRRDNPEGRIFIVGFCRGGTLSLHAGAEDFNLAGIIAFYAGLSRPVTGSKASTLEQAAQLHVPVLGLFGGADPGIPATDVQQLVRQLDVAGVHHEIVVYPGATHSFFDRRYKEFADESTDAWKRVLAFTGAI